MITPSPELIAKSVLDRHNEWWMADNRLEKIIADEILKALAPVKRVEFYDTDADGVLLRKPILARRGVLLWAAE